MATDFALDFKVLQHLRGYPEELRRYSNLMKQAHPRGISAVEFLLKRPPSPNGFIEAVCRFVRDGEDILSAVEAAERIGLSPHAFLERVAADSDFPPPLFGTEHRKVWRSADVDGYLKRHAAR